MAFSSRVAGPARLLNQPKAYASVRDRPYQAMIELLSAESLQRRRRPEWELRRDVSGSDRLQVGREVERPTLLADDRFRGSADEHLASRADECRDFGERRHVCG